MSGLFMTDLIMESCSLETILTGPVLGGSQLRVKGGQVEKSRSPFKGQTAERDGDGRWGKDMSIRKLEADLVCDDQSGSTHSGWHGHLRGAS